MISIKNVKKVFNKDTTPLIIFDDLSLEIETSKFTTILGRSGSGKSTLLNLIGSLDSVDSGQIIIDNVDITKLSKKEISKFRNEKIGFVFQSFFLEPSLSVIDNITLPLAVRGIKQAERNLKAVEVLKYLGIEHKQNELTGKLSGGEQQRVCIARALITDPSIILADEPTGHLDYENGQEVMKLLRNIANNGKTVLLVTHNLEDAENYSDRILYMKDGKMSNYDKRL